MNVETFTQAINEHTNSVEFPIKSHQFITDSNVDWNFDESGEVMRGGINSYIMASDYTKPKRVVQVQRNQILKAGTVLKSTTKETTNY